ncbi:hypothetical protein ACFLUK_01125 [Chloroflexota bacterium]
MEELKKMVFVIGKVLSIFLEEDLPDPRAEIFKKYPYIYPY